MFKAVHKFFCCTSSKIEGKSKHEKAQKDGTYENNEETRNHKHHSKENIDPENRKYRK